MSGFEKVRDISKRRIREWEPPHVDMVPEDFMDILDLWEPPAVGLVPEDLGWRAKDLTEDSTE
jgi:hypothetical protein